MAFFIIYTCYNLTGKRVTYKFEQPTTSNFDWIEVKFIRVDKIKFGRIFLTYKLTSNKDEELWNSRLDWRDELISYLDKILSQHSLGKLRVRNILLSKGSILFGIDISIGGLAAILGIINGLINLSKHIASFFRNRRRGYV